MLIVIIVNAVLNRGGIRSLNKIIMYTDHLVQKFMTPPLKKRNAIFMIPHHYYYMFIINILWILQGVCKLNCIRCKRKSLFVPGAAGVLVGHPFDTVKVGSTFIYFF